jgi:hypothetical protein
MDIPFGSPSFVSFIFSKMAFDKNVDHVKMLSMLKDVQVASKFFF